jgi:hypothetical protein
MFIMHVDKLRRVKINFTPHTSSGSSGGSHGTPSGAGPSGISGVSGGGATSVPYKEGMLLYKEITRVFQVGVKLLYQIWDLNGTNFHLSFENLSTYFENFHRLPENFGANRFQNFFFDFFAREF